MGARKEDSSAAEKRGKTRRKGERARGVKESAEKVGRDSNSLGDGVSLLRAEKEGQCLHEFQGKLSGGGETEDRSC